MFIDPLAVFRAELERRIRRLHRTLEGPDDDFPGMLFVEVAKNEILLVGRYDLGWLSDDAKATLTSLPSVVRMNRARRAGWAMPAWLHDSEPPGECLALVVCEPGRAQALVALVGRFLTRPPWLAPWGEPSAAASGLFVDPLLRALGEVKARGYEVDSLPPRRLLAACPDCAAPLSQPHQRGCDVEPCSSCGGQHLFCGCLDHEPLLEVWTGQWPGTATCRALGWYVVWRDGQGWTPCPPQTPRALEDLNRLAVYVETGRDCLYEPGGD